MKHIGILSDTHSFIDDRILAYLSSCDEIWHAGDIGSLDVTNVLKTMAPLRAVYGNIDNHDIRLEFPEDLCFETAGIKVYITHIAGRPGAYPTRVKAKISEFEPKIFVCGHSHVCLVKADQTSGMLHINPGAAGRHGFHHIRTLVRLKLDSGKVLSAEVVELGPRTSIKEIENP